MSLVKKLKKKNNVYGYGPGKKKYKDNNVIPDIGFVSPRNDLSEYNYTRTWEQGLAVEVYGYEVPIPDMPPKEEIINYGKPITEQIFRKTLMPEDFVYWTEEQQEVYIAREQHRRREGLWFYIKGEPIYIPGLFYYFLNYWPLATGKDTKFHMGDWKFFIIWMYTVLNPTVFGLIVFKCRRIGDTEKALCMVYEYATRVRNTISQLYDCRVEDDMKKTWKRLKIAHQRMIWFMKPVTKNDDPAESFEFRTPKRKVDTSNSYIDENGTLVMSEYKYKELDSEVSYFTNAGGADGARVSRGYVDEFGKFNQINPEDLWGLMRKALEDDREGEIIGKGLFTSTIEEMKGGDTLKVAKKMWKESDPSNVGPDGRTVSGLIRCVRGALDRAPTDRYGFVDEKGELDKIKKQQDFLIENKSWEQLIKFKRQNCLNIEDVFSNISKGSPFNLENINARKNELEYAEKKEYVRGNLKWVDGKKPMPGDPNKTNKRCKAYFEPDEENGRWYIRWHPKDFNLMANAMETYSVLPKPGNTMEFSAGIDPIDYKGNLGNADEMSKSGLSLKRNLDPFIDGSEMYEEHDPSLPKDLGRDFKTNRYCCHYLYRHDSPNDTFEDWLITLVYYGSDFLIEKNHSAAFNTFLELMGFALYYHEGGSGMSNASGKQEQLGLTATDKSVTAYFSAIAELTHKWINTLDIPIALEQLSTMEHETRGEHDLGVSIGFCELLSNKKINMISAQRDYDEQEDVEYMDEYVFSAD